MNVLYYRMVNQGYGMGSPTTYPTYPATSTALAPSTPTGLANTPAAMTTAGLASAAAAGLTPKWIIPNFSATQIQYMFRPRMGKGVKVNRAVKCETCSITLNSEQQAKQHYSGKSHLKKLRQMGLPTPGSEMGKVPAQSGKNKRKRSSSESKDSKSDEDGKESTTDSTSESNPDAKSETSENSAAVDLEEKDEEEQEEGDKKDTKETTTDDEDSPPKKLPRLSPGIEDKQERSEDHAEVKDTEGAQTNEKPEMDLENFEDGESNGVDQATKIKIEKKEAEDTNNEDQEDQDQDEAHPDKTESVNTVTATQKKRDRHIKMEHSVFERAKESSDKTTGIASVSRYSKHSSPLSVMTSSSSSHGYNKPMSSFHSNRSSMDYNRSFARPQPSSLSSSSSSSFVGATRSSLNFGNRTEMIRPGCLLPTPQTSAMSSYTPYQQFNPQGALSSSQLMSSGLQQYQSLGVSPYVPVAPLSFPQRSPSAPSQLSGVPGLLAPLYAPPAISSSPYSSLVAPQSATLGASPLSDSCLGGSLGTAAASQTGLLDMSALSSFQSLPLHSAHSAHSVHSAHQMGLQSETTMLSRQQQSYSQSHLSLAQFAISETTALPGASQAMSSGASQAVGASCLPSAASQSAGGATSSRSNSKLDPVTQAVYDNMMGKLPLKRKKNIPCTVCDMVFDSDIVANQHFLGAKHCKKARMMTEAEAVQSISGSPPTTATTESEALVKSINAFRCDVCNLELNSVQQLEQHNTGHQHIKNQKDKDRTKPAPFQWSPSALGWGEQAGNKSGWFYCQPCDISVQTAMQLQQHVRSQRHQDRPPGGYGAVAQESQD